MAAASPQTANLVALPSHLQSDTGLTSHIASRYHIQNPITNLSTQAIISVNTYTSAAKGHGGKDGNGSSSSGSAMAAAEELAQRMWTRLGARQESQAALFLGESGAGKTTIRSHLLSHLLQFSSTPLSKKLSFAAFVFDSLTTTKSTTTPTASKAGLFFELQYETTASMHPTLIGGKVLDHRLERSRVTAVPPGERNFHVLYYLLAGTSPAEKEHLGLDDGHVHVTSHGGNRTSPTGTAKRWRYLGHPSQLKVGINDAEGFQHFKTALRKLEFPRDEIAHMCEILAAILHIGQLEFVTTTATTPAPDESGGYGAEGGEDVTVVKNKDILTTVAAFLGVAERDLEQSLGYRSKILHRERVTIMLDPKGARENADELARTLYSLFVAFIMEKINSRLSVPDADDEGVANTISLVDFPGFAATPATNNTLDQLLSNAANESLYNFCLEHLFERKADMLETEEVAVPATSYFDNSDAVKGLLKPGNGLLSILDDQMRRGKTDVQCLDSLRKRFQDKNPAIEISSATQFLPGTNFPTHNATASFTVRHFAGEVEYPVEGLMEANGEVISGDLMNLMATSGSDFVNELFGQRALEKVVHPRDAKAVQQASVASKPSRMPSMAKRRKGDRPARLSARQSGGDGSSDEGDFRRNPSRSKPSTTAGELQQGAAEQFMSSLDALTKALTAPNTNPYFVFCLKPNDRRIANQFDSKCVRTQIQTLGIAEISQRLRNADFSLFMPFGEFLGLAEGEVSVVGTEKEKAEMIAGDKFWPANEARAGSTGVFLSERCWRQIANVQDIGGSPAAYVGFGEEAYGDVHGQTKGGFGESKVTLLNTPYGDDKGGVAGYFGSRDLDAKSDAGASAFREGDMFRNLETRSQMAEKGNEAKMQEVEEVPVTGSRKRWLALVWALTWWCPTPFIRIFGRITRKDVQVAWREKLAINLIIWFSCAFIIFFMVGIPAIICPTQHVYSEAELTSYNGKDGATSYIAIRGVVFQLDHFIPAHYPSIVPESALKKYAGTDATNLFPVQVSAMCQGLNESGINPAVQLNYKTYNYTGQSSAVSTTDTNSQYHDFRWATNDSRPDWFTEQMIMLRGNYWKGNVGYPPDYLKKLASKDQQIGHINKRVYDFTDYIAGGRSPQYPPGYDEPDTKPSSNFMDQGVVDLFQQRSGQDLTKYWNALDMTPAMRQRMQVCMDNLFYVGDLDTRNSAECLFAKYILLAISLLLVTIIGVKFLAALQFSSKNVPENLDKFIIATVPAYTEDEESLRRAIDSAARLRYDDKRKLLFIICDGMIIGQGNDRPTPRIVLDILGVPDTVDPEPLSFESLGEGQKQHNMGKVYSGLYEVQGHIVPFIVVVKVGKPSEVSR